MVAVVDHEGILRYRSKSPPRKTELREAIETALAELPAEAELLPEDMSLVEEDGEDLPGSFALEENYPNPFNASTTIRFALADEGPVFLRIYDIHGRQIRQLLGTSMPAGIHVANWGGEDRAGRNLASGVYLFQLEAAGRVLTRKMLLLR